MKSVVGWLIVANIAAYFIEKAFYVPVLANFALWPWGTFGDGTGVVVGFKFWQLLTYGFLHDPSNYAHIGLNLYALYAFGLTVEQRLGTDRFVWLYFVSVVVAGLTQLVVSTMSIDSGVVPTLGASGGVFGVLLAFGMLFPHRRVMLIFPPIPMPAWVLVGGYAAIELANGIFGMNTGVAHFAHLGGALGAFIVLQVIGYKRFRDSRLGY